MDNGWIKIHRTINTWEWRSHPLTVALWLFLLTNANLEEKTWKGVVIKRGQLAVGRNSLSKQTGMSPQQVRTCLSNLKSTNQITIESTNRFSVITILNWEKYQAPSTNQSTNKPTQSQPQRKNIRNKEESQSADALTLTDKQVFLLREELGVAEFYIRKTASRYIDWHKGKYPKKKMNLALGVRNWLENDLRKGVAPLTYEALIKQMEAQL